MALGQADEALDTVDAAYRTEGNQSRLSRQALSLEA